MTTNLTAAQARELMPQNQVETQVEAILLQVEKAAKAGESSIKTYACDFGSSALYGGKPTTTQQAVIDRLIGLGYRCQIRCEERQFVDIYLYVAWSAE